MHLELTVTLGDLVTAAVFVLTIVAAYTRLAERLVALETKVDALWQAWLEGGG